MAISIMQIASSRSEPSSVARKSSGDVMTAKRRSIRSRASCICRRISTGSPGSDIDGLLLDMPLQVGVHLFPVLEDIHMSMKSRFQLFLDMNESKQIGIVKLHNNIDITLLSCLIACNGTEEADRRNAVSLLDSAFTAGQQPDCLVPAEYSMLCRHDSTPVHNVSK